MENMKIKIKKMNTTSIIFSIIFIILGAFLISMPDYAIKLVSYALGIIFIILGLVAVVDFFSDRDSQDFLNFNFVIGVFSLIFGLIIMAKTEVIASIIPLLLGVWMLINGVIKLSYSLSLNNKENALISIIVSILIIILGILLIFNPFDGAQALVQILGIEIIVYSVLDLVECFSLKSVFRKFNKAKKEESKVIDVDYEEKK